MTALLLALHWLAGLITLAEALNKLERTAPLSPGLSPRERATDWLKAIAWGLLAIGAAGALISPAMHREPPTLPDVCILFGFAVLIIRTRIKEG